eukprot:1159717-Pelagomonas_calceolata.AAC.1
MYACMRSGSRAAGAHNPQPDRSRPATPNSRATQTTQPRTTNRCVACHRIWNHRLLCFLYRAEQNFIWLAYEMIDCCALFTELNFIWLGADNHSARKHNSGTGCGQQAKPGTESAGEAGGKKRT